MPATLVQSGTGDPGGWNGSITGVTAGNTLIFMGIGTTSGSPSVSSVKSSQDGDLTQDYFVTGVGGGGRDIVAVYRLDNASAGTHSIAVVEAGINENESVIFELSGLAAGGPEDTENGSDTASTSHSAPANLDTAGDAVLLMCHGISAGAVETPGSGWESYVYNPSRAGFTYQEVSGAGAYAANWTTSASVDSTTFAVAYAGAGGGGATTYTQSVAGSITPTGDVDVLVRIAANITGSITPAGALSRSISKSLAGSTTPVGSIAKLIRRTLTGSSTSSGALSSQVVFTSALDGSTTPAGALAKKTSKSFAGSTTPAGAIAKKTFKTFTGSITAAGARARQVYKSLSGSITAVGSIAIAWVIAVAGSITPVGTIGSVHNVGGGTSGSYIRRFWRRFRR